MRWHRITDAEVELAIQQPDFLEPSDESRFNAWKKILEKYLKVSYKQEKGQILVITAVKKKKGWR
jgi:hypothetical protein